MMKRKRHTPGGRTNIKIVLKQNPGELETQFTSSEPTGGHRCPWRSVQGSRDMADGQPIETFHHSFIPLKKMSAAIISHFHLIWLPAHCKI